MGRVRVLFASQVVVPFVTLFAVAALPAAARAETMYVTDNLRLGLHQAADTSDRAFRVLDSGQALEVVSRNRNYALVELPDGARGYVKAAYLVDEKPAKLIVEEVRSERDALAERLAALEQEFSGSGARIQALEARLAEQAEALETSRAAVAELTEENDAFRSRLAVYRFSLPWPIVLGAVLVCLVLGFAAGTWWFDYRSRRRHGGFRIY